MKKRVSAIIFAMIICTFNICVYAAAQIPFTFFGAEKSVVRITVNNSFGTEEVTGTVIGSKYILTSLRAIEGYTGDLLVGGTGEQNIKARGVIASSPELNLAVIELTEEIKNVKIASFKDGDVGEGTEVYALGYYCRDDKNEVREGMVSSQNTFQITGRQFDIYQVTAEITERNNGGALVDKFGDVVGVNFYDGNAAQNKAITSKEIINMLKEKNIPFNKASFLVPVLIIVAALLIIGGIVFLIIMLKRNKDKKAPALLGVSGEYTGSRITIAAQNVNIGRDAKSCQIIIMNDPKVSRCHCSVRYDSVKRMFTVTDLSSTHGTYINGAEKLTPKVPAIVPPDSVISLGDGNTAFQLVVGGGSR